MNSVKASRNVNVEVEALPPVDLLMDELGSGICHYWDTARNILEQSGVRLKAMPDDYLSFNKNFFSLLFLYSFYRAGIAKPRRILYSSILQCQRGMVTGCDNILDDEYKMTLHTDLPETGYRFRSVIDIMVSDRVLFYVLFESGLRHEIDMPRVLAASAASMKTMARSGIQEASEEAGITSILSPDAILKTVHHFKTGILFQCPWDVPLVIESLSKHDVAHLLEGLYQVGMGCQLLDDIVDFHSDLSNRRHNYLVSVIHHGGDASEKGRLDEICRTEGEQLPAASASEDFPQGMTAVMQTAHRFLESGLTSLLADEHRFLTHPFISFMKKRIGTANFAQSADT